MAVMAATPAAAALDGSGAVGRLGLDQPAGWWPTTPRLKSYEAAGFSHLQVRMPPRALLADPAIVAEHALALNDSLRLTDLRLILHAPDDLLAGTPEHDRQFAGALEYAAIAGSDLVIYHGARVPIAARDVRGRLRDEYLALRRFLPRAAALGVRLAIENLAPVYPGPEFVCFLPAAVGELVRRLDSEQAGMCLDLGHAHIVAGLAGVSLAELVEPVLEQVIVFHVHDNFGATAGAARPGGLDPLRFDLHLPPGAGSLPWAELAARLRAHPAPLQLEVQPPARPEPAALAVVTRELLGLASPCYSRAGA
jgi:sugar phosphate isomerase/epimerase